MAEVISGRPVRIDAYIPIGTVLDDIVSAEDMTAWVVSPILLTGRTWGSISVVSRRGPLPAGAEDRLAAIDGMSSEW